METKRYSVYNPSTESFLSTDATVIDTRLEPLKVLRVMIDGLALNAEACLWLTPFDGIPQVPRLSPFDLLYLDAEFRVLLGAELLPGSGALPINARAASALVLPYKSLSASNTRAGQQLVIEPFQEPPATQPEAAASSASAVEESTGPNETPVAAPAVLEIGEPRSAEISGLIDTLEVFETQASEDVAFKAKAESIPTEALPADDSSVLRGEDEEQAEEEQEEEKQQEGEAGKVEAPNEARTEPITTVEVQPGMPAKAEPKLLEVAGKLPSAAPPVPQPDEVATEERGIPATPGFAVLSQPVEGEVVPPVGAKAAQPAEPAVAQGEPIAEAAEPIAPGLPTAKSVPEPVEQSPPEAGQEQFRSTSPSRGRRNSASAKRVSGKSVEVAGTPPAPAPPVAAAASGVPHSPSIPFASPSASTPVPEVKPDAIHDPGLVSSEPAKEHPVVRFLRWLDPTLVDNPERRGTLRRKMPELVAYQVKESGSKQYRIGNISSTGIYLYTDERWPSSELILLTLQAKGPLEKDPERRVMITVRPVRWGENGVGFRFVLPDGMDLRLWEADPETGTDIKRPEYVVNKIRLAGALAFVRRICPAVADGVVQLFEKELSSFRASNAVEIALLAEQLLAKEKDGGKMRAHPAVVLRILESGSWSEFEFVRLFWAGMMSTACTIEGNDDSNLSFVDMLTLLTAMHLRILMEACARVAKQSSQPGADPKTPIYCTPEEILKITGSGDRTKIDRAVNLLGELRLIETNPRSHFYSITDPIKVTPTKLGFQLLTLCNGQRAKQ